MPHAALASFWRRNTYGSATLDIARTHIFDDAIESSAVEALRHDPRDASVVSKEETTSNPFIPLDAPKARFSSSGVRLKVMRHVTLGPERMQRVHGIHGIHGVEERCPIIDAAAGVSFEFDSASFHPKARVRLLRTVSIGAFPCAHVKVQRRIPIGLTGFSLKVMYFCPLRQLPRAFDAPARLMLSVDDTDHWGVRLVTNGIEVAGNRVFTPTRGTQAVLMGSALVTVPNTLDVATIVGRGRAGGGDFSVRLGRTACKFKF